MQFLLKRFSTYRLFTFLARCVNPFILQINKPIVPTRELSPMAPKKGILTLTLVISRESARPAVRSGFCVMFKIFKVNKIKTQLELAVEEYIEFKAQSTYMASEHKDILLNFIGKLPHKSLWEITVEDLDAFHDRMMIETTPYTTFKAMKVLRQFMRFHKHKTNIRAKEITDLGVNLQNVEENVIIPPMNTKRTGRPYADVELIKQIKRLKDKEKISFRKIGLAVGKDVSHVYRMYRYDLTKTS